jgi:hypothetical protein
MIDGPVIPASIPDAVSAPSVGARTTSSVVISWVAPDTGGRAITNYNIRYSSDSGAFWTDANSTSDLTATVTGLTVGTNYVFQVAATNVEGTGLWSVSSATALAASVPGTVNNIAIPQAFGGDDLQIDRINLEWTSPNTNGTAITGYVIRTSSNGSDWSQPISSGSVAAKYSVIGLPMASSRLIQVAAVNNEGQGDWSEPFLGTTDGFTSKLVSVVDSNGIPVTGGAITWQMDNGAARSSITYGLTADGIIQFPAAPSGAVTVTVSNVQLQDGTYVSGIWNTVLGYDATVLELPEAPQISRRTAHVTLGSSGVGVSNVQVTFSQMPDLADEVMRDGFTFKTKSTSLTGQTDTNGNFTVYGYSNSTPYIQAAYDDGVISQYKSDYATGEVTQIKLRSLPFATFDIGTVTGVVGAPVPVVVTAGTGNIESNVRNFIARENGTPRSVVSGMSNVKVTLVPPAGAATKCASKSAKQVLTERTDASGKAKLLVCPTRSGVYKLKTQGALSIGYVQVLVKGAPPVPVSSVTLKSPTVGSVRASWAKPFFDGGSPVTSYVVTLAAPGKPTVTKTLAAVIGKTGKITKAAPTVLDVKGLANATTYTVTIKALNVKGASDVFTTKIPVA